MRKIYSLLLFFILGWSANAQYQLNGAANSSPSPGYPNEFQLIPAVNNSKGSVFKTTQINLNQNFELNVQLYFGTQDNQGGDGIAFVLQNENAGYIGNSGAGIGYHRFNSDIPGPVPSVIVEFDTYQNGFINGQDIGDPSQDHLGFMSGSNAYHTNSTALAPPVAFPVNIEDGLWHDAKFSWNAASHMMTVLFLGNTYSYTGDIVTNNLAGNPLVYWGFTSSAGGLPNEHRLRIINLVIGQPLTVTGTVTNTCTGGSIDVTVTGGNTPYTYSWSNGSISQDLMNVSPGSYTVTVTDASGATKQATFTVTGDNVAPQVSCAGAVTLCSNLSGYYSIPQITATDNCGTPTTTYVITGATHRSGTGNNASGTFNAGTSTITWTVKDAKGNTSTCSTQVNINKVSVTIPDVYAVNPGGNANTIYIGYGPTSLTLTANASGGTAPYSYWWSTGATSQSITVSPSSTGVYTYLVIVTDAKGCYSYVIKKIKVVDVRCGRDKVTVCHIPPGNPKKADEICISKNAVADHLAHGDHLGSCHGNKDNHDGEDGDDDDDHGDHGDHGGDHGDLSKGNELVTEAQKARFVTGIYPNPTNGRFEIQLSNAKVGTAQVMIVNSNGGIVERKAVQLNEGSQILKFDLSKQAAGIYLLRIISQENIRTEKIIIQR